MSIPRLELIAAHTLAKLQNNVSKALSNFPITACHSWVDSTTVLYWLSNHGEWSIFVRKWIKKIDELTESKWRYVPTAENPSNLGTRGSAPSRLGKMWFQGPSWQVKVTDQFNQRFPSQREPSQRKSQRRKEK
ncbi:uncharacterized protein [Ptychodera flava]|uniref:uncharacterized protein n=1 Tax=Ptychodera flava TaxID=63121 RepID=UPI00396A7D40